MWTKICANTNVHDARLAAELGADALGFIFASSPRQVVPSQVKAITQALPEAVERIGVFQTHAAGEILDAVKEAQLTGVQLHGRLDLDLIRELRRMSHQPLTLIQALHWDTTPGALPPAENLAHQLDQIREQSLIEHVLIDSRFGSASGGTGIRFDWNAAAELFRSNLGDLKLILAGGLRPENLDEAIGKLHPWGLDVASGVESTPGTKDPQKLEAFLRKASSQSS